MKHAQFRKYLPAKGFCIGAADAQTMGETIERLQQLNGGGCTPVQLLQYATPADSPVHDFFEWDDAKAGHRWRLAEARSYIRAIEIVVEHNEKRERQRANHLVQKGDDRVYVSFENVVQNQDMADQVLAKAKRELVQWYNRYKRIERLNGMALVLQAIEAAGIVTVHTREQTRPEPTEIDLAEQIAAGA